MYGGEPGPAPPHVRAATRLQVYLLGRFEVVRWGVPIPRQAWRRRRPADLLKLVALTPGRALERDAAVETLWPDKDPASGANNLHRALYDLRQILGARWVDLERGRLRLDPDVWLDVDAFEAAARSADPAAREAAVALYRGDLSPGDGDSWLVRHRERLRALRDVVQHRDAAPPPGQARHDGYRRAARRLLGTAEPAPLRGRTASLALFESLVEQGAGAIFLLGERGVGKSRLAVEGARIAQQAGAVVATGVFDPIRARPYGCFAELFTDPVLAGGEEARDPFADLARARGGGVTRVLESVRAQLAAIGAGRPVYLLVDDVHEADEGSAHLLHVLARSARALRLMLVATCREDAVHAGTPAQTLLSHLDCERLARGIRVQRLDLAASRDQLRDLLDTSPGDALSARFYRLTDGSPFYTEELARAFEESGHVHLPDDPVTALRERVERLGSHAVTFLEVAAVCGRHFEFEVVRRAAGLSADDALGTLEQVLQARIVVDDGTAHHFHHSLARDALYDGLAPERRVALHRAVADAIEERALATMGGIDEVNEPLAYHRRAGDQPDRAFGHLVTAGQRAAARAGLRDACGHLEAALAIADAAGASGPHRLELLESLVEVQLALADIPGALRSVETAMALGDRSGWRPGPDQRARAHRSAAVALLVCGRAAEAKAHLDAGLDDARLGSGDERAQLRLLSGQLAWHQGRAISDAVDGGTEAVPAEVHLALWENDLLGDRGATELEAAATAFRELAVRSGVPGLEALARAMGGVLGAQAGRLDDAEAALRDALARARTADVALVEAFALDALAALLTTRGRLDDALSLAGEGIVIGERSPLRRHVLLRLHATLARNRLAAGAVCAAEDALREASELAARHGACAVCESLYRPEMVRVALARGRPAAADVEAQALEALAQRRGGGALWAIARTARGRVLAAARRRDEADAAFLEASARWEAIGAVAEAARARSLAAGAAQGPAVDGGEDTPPGRECALPSPSTNDDA